MNLGRENISHSVELKTRAFESNIQHPVLYTKRTERPRGSIQSKVIPSGSMGSPQPESWKNLMKVSRNCLESQNET